MTISTRSSSKSLREEDVNQEQNHVEEKKSHKKERRKPMKNAFEPRTSHLDTSEISRSEFRGFFNLFALALLLFFLTAETHHIFYEGTVVGIDMVISMFNRFDLLPAWLFIVGLSFGVCGLQRLIVKGVLHYSWLTELLYISLQLFFFCSSLFILLERRWPVVQTAFFICEMIVLFMKMHSYFRTNKEIALRSHPLNSSVRYPDNVTWSNYLYFLIIPTFVYELDYPRTEKVRISYVLEKVASMAGIWGVLHVLVSHYITPVFEKTPYLPAWEAVGLLMIPFLLGFLLIFFLIFDVICNGIAEITRFGDRRFYSDWWNCTTWDEFARKWNRPVHEWLLRHVYLEGIEMYKMSSISAAVVTFLFSSLIHEFVMAATFRLVRPWLFMFQMGQLPLIYFGRYLKGTTAGNFFFWFGIMIGPPLISILYMREYYLVTP